MYLMFSILMLEPIAEDAAAAGKGREKIRIPTVSHKISAGLALSLTLSLQTDSANRLCKTGRGGYLFIFVTHSVMQGFWMFKILLIKWYYHLSMSRQPFGEPYHANTTA